MGAVVLALTVSTGCGGGSYHAGHLSRLRPGQIEPVDYDYDYDDFSSNDYSHASNRSRDPYPLTELEVFGFRKAGVALQGGHARGRFHYIFQGRGRLDSDCSQAVWGDRLKTALRHYGCTQVLRGVYADRTKLIAAHVAIFNLMDVASGKKFLGDLDPEHHKGFVQPLSGQAAPLDRFGSGYTGAWGSLLGHYVMIEWVGYTNEIKTNSARNIYRLKPWDMASHEALESAFIDFWRYGR